MRHSGFIWSWTDPFHCLGNYVAHHFRELRELGHVSNRAASYGHGRSIPLLGKLRGPPLLHCATLQLHSTALLQLPCSCIALHFCNCIPLHFCNCIALHFCNCIPLHFCIAALRYIAMHGSGFIWSWTIHILVNWIMFKIDAGPPLFTHTSFCGLFLGGASLSLGRSMSPSADPKGPLFILLVKCTDPCSLC